MDFGHQKPPGIRGVRRVCVLIAAVTVLVAALTPAIAHADKLSVKRAQAAQVEARVNKLSEELDHLNELVKYRESQLAQARANSRRAHKELVSVQKSFDHAQSALIQRSVAIYTSGSAGSKIMQFAESGTLSGLLDRIQTISSINASDNQLVARLETLKVRLASKRARMAQIEKSQLRRAKQVLASRNAMASKTAAQRAILNSVTAEVRKLVAARKAAALAEARVQAAAQAAAVRNQQPEARSAPSPFSAPALAPPSASGSASEAAGIALRYLGVPYVWGGSTPSGFDCSGLVMFAFAQVGMSLPHSSYALYNIGTRISKSDLQRGDLVFFSGLGHVGIYLGGNTMVHAPHSGSVVNIASLDGWYESSYVGAVRL